MNYSIAIETKNNLYIGYSPDIENLKVECATIADTIAHARQSIIEYLNTLVENGQKIPQVTHIDEHLMKPQFAGVHWAIITLNINSILNDNVEITINCPKNLYIEIKDFLEKEGLGMNTFLLDMIRNKIT